MLVTLKPDIMAQRGHKTWLAYRSLYKSIQTKVSLIFSFYFDPQPMVGSWARIEPHCWGLNYFQACMGWLKKN